MNENEWEFRRQEQFGRVYSHDDCIIFSVSVYCTGSVVSIDRHYSYDMFVIYVAVMSMYGFVLCGSFRIIGDVLVNYKVQHLLCALNK